MILLTIVHLWPLDRVAAIFLMQLAGWGGVAALLNYAIWRLNG